MIVSPDTCTRAVKWYSITDLISLRPRREVNEAKLSGLHNLTLHNLTFVSNAIQPISEVIKYEGRQIEDSRSAVVSWTAL